MKINMKNVLTAALLFISPLVLANNNFVTNNNGGNSFSSNNYNSNYYGGGGGFFGGGFFGGGFFANHTLTKNIYVMENNPQGNRIVNYKEYFGGGVLYRVERRNTGGLGAGDNAPADPLGSQGSLLLSENRQNLYAVNAGSNNISVFSINRLGFLRLIQVINSEGDFPVSLTQDDDFIYVLNAGGDGNVTGFTVSPSGRLDILNGSQRSLSLGGEPVPVGNARNLAPGQLSFDKLARQLIVVNAGGNGGAGELIAFNVDDDGNLSATSRNIASEGAVPFSLDFSKNGIVLVAEASGSVSSYSIGLAPISSVVSNQQTETCWIKATDQGSAYTANTGSGTISRYEVSRSGQLTLANATAASGLSGPIDFDISNDGKLLVVLEAFSGRLKSFNVDTESGSLTPLSSSGGLPVFDNVGFSAQGLVIR